MAGAEIQHWVALLRGVNVGGANRLAMAELRSLCGGLGWEEVQSYIASGNLVFRAAGEPGGLARTLRHAMAEAMGVDVEVLVLSPAEIAKALADCPFDPASGNQCHAFFLWSDPHIDWAVYDQLRAPDEGLAVDGRRAWLHTPSGIGRSRLAEKLDKVIRGTGMTARNLNTLRKLVEMST